MMYRYSSLAVKTFLFLSFSKGAFSCRQTIQARDVGWAVLDVALSPDGRHLGKLSVLLAAQQNYLRLCLCLCLKKKRIHNSVA